MRIQKVVVENFKCFEKLDVEFGKLTLLTGANSSGKSSLIYSILGTLQSGGFPMKYSTNGKYVNMGDYEDISFVHDRNNVIKIAFSIISDNPQPISPKPPNSVIDIETFWNYDRDRKLPRLQKLVAKEDYYTLVIEEKSNLYHLEFDYNSDLDPAKAYNSLEWHNKFNKLMNAIFEETADKSSSSAEKGSSKQQDDYLKRIERKFKDQNNKIKLTADSLDQLPKIIDEKGSFVLEKVYRETTDIFRNLNSNINYISSFRFNPQKLRYEISKSDLTVGKYGENYEDQIVEWENQNSPKYKDLLNILKKLNILKDVKTKRISGGNYELKIKTHTSGVFSSLTDVGFGISQFLPIIVADIQLPKNSTLFISQPEIHLHPSIQSDFGDYIVDQLINSQKNYVIETHSEYLLNKIRLLIVKKKLDPKLVKIYYFRKDRNKVEKFQLEFEPTGEIKNAPKDFFKTYMVDVMNIALHA